MTSHITRSKHSRESGAAFFSCGTGVQRGMFSHRPATAAGLVTGTDDLGGSACLQRPLPSAQILLFQWELLELLGGYPCRQQLSYRGCAPEQDIGLPPPSPHSEPQVQSSTAQGPLDEISKTMNQTFLPVCGCSPVIHCSYGKLAKTFCPCCFSVLAGFPALKHLPPSHPSLPRPLGHF